MSSRPVELEHAGTTAFIRRRALRPDFGATGAGIVNWQNVIIVDVAGGGDATTIQDAIDGISDATVTNKYLILINGGDYITSSLTMKAHVYLQGRGINTTRLRLTNSASGAIIGIEDSGIADLTLFGSSSGSNFTVKVADGINRWRCDNVYMHGRFDLAGGNYNDCGFTGNVQVGGTDTTFPPTFTNPQFGYLPTLTSTAVTLTSSTGDYAYINGGYVLVGTVTTEVNVKFTGTTFLFSGSSVTFNAEGEHSSCSFLRIDDDGTDIGEITSPQGSFANCLFRDVGFKATANSGPINISGSHLISTGTDDPILLPESTALYPIVVSGSILENTAGGTVIGKAGTTGAPMIILSGNVYRGIIDVNAVNSARITGTDVKAEFYPVSLNTLAAGTIGTPALVGTHQTMELNATDECYIPVKINPPSDTLQIVDLLLLVSGLVADIDDDFTEGSDTALASHTADTGETWTLVSGTATVRTATGDVDGSDGGIHTLSTGSIDGTIQADIVAPGSGSAGAGLIFRYSDSDNYWRLEADGDTNIQLIKRESGSESVIASHDISNAAITLTLGVSFYEDDIKCYLLGVTGSTNAFLLFETTDTFNNTATVVGLKFGGSAWSVDNYRYSQGDHTIDLDVTSNHAPETMMLTQQTDVLNLTNQPVGHEAITYLDCSEMFTDLLDGSLIGFKVALVSLGTPLHTALRVHGMLARTLPGMGLKSVQVTQSVTASQEKRQVTYR